MIHKNSQLPFPANHDEFREIKGSLKRIEIKTIQILALVLLFWLPIAVNAALTLPAIPSNSSLAKRFELSTEMVFRVKVGETYLTGGALIAYINGEIRGAQTASMKFPATGINVYKVLVFNDKTGDNISFKYYDIFADKIYDITEIIEFVPNQVPDYANPGILTAFCKPIDKVTGLLPENGKENLNSTLDLFWQPSPNTSFYKVYVWEDGTATPTTPTYSNVYSTTARVYNLKYGQLYRWKIGSVNDCSSEESPEQTFRIRQLPDLTGTQVQAPPGVESGTFFPLSFRIKNIGAGNTAGIQWNDAVFVSVDATLSNDDKLLSNTTNLRQLDPDSSYTNSVTVSLPIDYKGNYFFIVKTDYYNSVPELLENNNELKSTNATAVTLKTLPDILVKDIQPMATNVNPGDSIIVNWKVENIGGTTAKGGWTERITIVPVSGAKITISPNTEYRDSLKTGITLNRGRKIKIPDLPKFSGGANIEVELIPFPELLEYSANKANNKAESADMITLSEILSLDFQTASVLENSPNPVRCIVNRSGDFLTQLVVTLATSVTGQVTIPATVTIPAGQSSVSFNLSTINNSVLQGTRVVEINASAASFANAVNSISIFDDEIPKLTAVLSKSSATEGETIELTIKRDLVTAQEMSVSIATNKPNQWTFTAPAIIPANKDSIKVSVVITDDNVPELTSDAVINISSAGVTTGQVTGSIVDNDLPQVNFEILTDTVSESAGIYATWGLISRVKGNDNITVNLTQSPAGALFFPATISLPKGVGSQKFNIGVVDNGEVDGFRNSVVTGSIYISSCNCGTTPDNGGVITDDLVIADNDGPSLSISVFPLSLPEGKQNAGTLTISRNTPPTQALDVSIYHNDPTEVGIPTTATILAGQKSVQVPISTINDNIEDGNQMISLQVSAPSFSSGYGYVFVTDLNKPDMEITDMLLNTDTVATNEIIEITGSALNSGFGTAPSGVKIKFYYSKDKTIDSGDKLLGEYAFASPVLQGAAADFITNFNVPDETGKFFILGKINPDQAITELEYFNNEAEPADFTITPEYNVSAIADNDLYMPGTTITIHGAALNNNNQKVPNVDVDVYILTQGTRRELKAKTNSSGEYSVDFVPVSSETGHYSIGGCFPNQKLSNELDNFDIPGLVRESSANIIWEMTLGQTLVGKIGIRNTSEATLNKLVVSAENLPQGCELKFDSIAVLQGNQTKEFTFMLKANELTVGNDYEKINFKVNSIEGITTEFKSYYYCQALHAQLKTDPVSINTTMTKGKSRFYELYLYNNGAGESGEITISLPNVDWMTLVSPSVIKNLLPGDTTQVIINLTPAADTPLNTPISGGIAVNCINGTGLLLPYRIEAVSEETGGVEIDVIDEYTYYTEAKPHVKNAHVMIRHPFSGAMVAEGFTGEDGIFSVGNIPEGAYRMIVEADKHEGFQTTITVDPGRVNKQTVFLSFQAISYTWEVVPTEIEDNYEVQLVMKYETNVPVPVVIIDMPEEMPQLFNEETFPFMITLTNKGLITALDVDLILPQDDPEYVFLTNFSKLDILAQQAIQIPVVMKRRDALKSGEAVETTSGPCNSYVASVYGYECGKDKKWHQTSKGFSFKFRICTGPGGGDGGGWGGTYYGGYDGDASRSGPGWSKYWADDNVPGISKPTIQCDKCAIDVLQALLGCLELHPVVNVAVNIIGCVLTFMEEDPDIFDQFGCLASFVPTKYAREIYQCLLGVALAIKSCYETNFQKSGSLKSIEASNIPPILQQSVRDLETFLRGNNAADSIISEFMGSEDWKSKESFNDFAAQIQSFISSKKPFLPEELALIQQQMNGTDMSNDEIGAFVYRWNSTLEAYAKNITKPTSEYPNIVDIGNIDRYNQRVDSVMSYSFSRGFTDVKDMLVKSVEGIKSELESSRSSVCAAVTINITQKVVMTREAFEGTLTIYNGNKTTAMKEIKLNLEIKDENGVLSNDLFQIDTKALSILTGIDGTGTLGPDQKGSATVLFIPEKGAAPTTPKSYSFGGSFSYLDPFTGVTVTKPLFPVTLDVNPSPDLYLHYFMQRDILGDDALTVPIEPIVPAELAVMVENNGFGTAKNVRIESAQPKIVENEKGLAINFALIGSNLNGQPTELGLTNISFGNIAPKTATIGQWWFTSDLLGHFVSYETKLTHLDSRGNPDLSLISGVSLHELIKSVRVYSGGDDGINDFLVNEVQDTKETPDIIYRSNGGTLDVYPAVSQSASGSVSTGIDLLVLPQQIGWNYIKFADPGNGARKIVSVTRSDGQVIPLDNVWQTHVTLPDGEEPIYEAMIHFLDVFATNTTQKYTILFSTPAQSPPAIVKFENVPTSFVTNPVTSINVIFNKPIDVSTFNYEDMTLRVQGGADIMDATVLVTEINQTTFKVDLTSKSTLDGYYVLNVQTAGIKDLLGTNGVEGKQANWTQFIGIPAVREFIGLPDNKVGAPFDLLLVRFNVPIDKITFTPARLLWKKDGTTITGSVVITEMDTEGKLFQLSGLQSFMTADGMYSLSVDLPNIKSLDGNNGIVVQSVDWKIDQTAPGISQIVPSTEGGYDSQHRTAFTVKFNEAVNGLVVNSLELWKDGQRQPISQLNLTKINGSDYKFTQFRLLTYYDGAYQLKVKMKDITDNAGNSGTDTIKFDWIVLRTAPKAITNLHITPDMGFSDNDAITATKNLVVQMTVNQANSRIQIYQTDKVNPILLADTMNVNIGPLSLPVSLSYAGNVTIEAHCIDTYTNTTVTELPVFIDETSLVSGWKNAPLVPLTSQPKTLEMTFSDKLLDDSKLMEYLKFEREGKSLGTEVLTISKSNDKLYVLSGMDLAGIAGGTYSITLDLSKLQKYNSGKQGVAVSKVQWDIISANDAPIANAVATPSNLVLSSGQTKTAQLNGSGSVDPDGTIASFRWTLLSGPAASAIIQNPDSETTLVSFSTVGSYVFKLTVTDNKGATDNTSITVTVAPSANIPPVASAVATPSNLVLDSGQTKTAQLNGSGSVDQDGTIASFNWSLVSGPTTGVIIQNPGSETTLATFSAIGSYTFKLTVTDNKGESDNTTITVTVVAAANIPPVAVAVATPSNLVLNSGQTKTAQLDGSGSVDQDGTIASFNWSLVSGPTTGVIIQNPGSETTLATFSAIGSYTFKLTVTDNKGESDNTTITVTVVAAAANIPPVASAVATPSNLVLNSGQTKIAQLNGSGSVDPDGTIESFSWSLVSGPTTGVTIQNPGSETTLASFSTVGSYTFKLTVTDNKGESDNTTITVTVVASAANNPPIANAGPDQVVNEGVLVTLNGSSSSDPDGNALTYKWTAPAGITLSSTTAAKPTFTVSDVIVNTSYTITLVVNDGLDNSLADQVVITIKNVPNNVPVANAGRDLVVNKGATVSLDGSASTDQDGNPLTYKWTAPAGITLSSTTAMKPTFTAPNVIINTSYTITLVVNDGFANSSADQVVVTIKTSNSAPTANAGSDLIVNKGATVSLDGTASTDPDGNPLTYQWTAPAGITLSSATDAKPTFTAPAVIINTSYTLTLKVNDGLVDSPADQVVITIKTSNSAPAANAGSDQVANEGSIITLNGSASTDPDSNPLTYKWTVPAGITLSSNTVSKPTFTAPEVNINTSYTLILVVNDGLVDSPTDQVVVTIRQVNKAPLANAGPDQSINEGTVVTLDGSASTDPDGNPLTYNWTAPAGITLSSATAAKPTFTAPEVAVNTSYTFVLTVNDGLVNSSVSEVIVTVKNVGSTSIQNISLTTGWNIFSANLIPENADLTFLFKSLIDDGSLVKVQDEKGNSFEDWGILGGWTNNIGNLIPGKGYKVKVKNGSQLDVLGTPSTFPFKIPLDIGWNIIGFPKSSVADALLVVQQLIDRGTLIKVQDEKGNSLEDWGILGGWTNNIGNFIAGEGYKIKVRAKDTLTIYETYSSKSAFTAQNEMRPTVHFLPAFEGNGVDHMNINLIGLPDGLLNPGDELAVFDGGVCVGAVNLMPHHLTSQTVSIAASATDNLGMEGFNDGNPITLKLWILEKNQEFKLELELVKGTSIFTKHETTVASLEKYATTGLEGIQATNVPEIKVFPNPFKDEVTIEINMTKDAEVEVEVMNQLGQQVKMITTKKQFNPGVHRLTWNGRNASNGWVSPGVYYLRIEIDNTISRHKIVLSR